MTRPMRRGLGLACLLVFLWATGASAWIADLTIRNNLWHPISSTGILHLRASGNYYCGPTRPGRNWVFTNNLIGASNDGATRTSAMEGEAYNQTGVFTFSHNTIRKSAGYMIDGTAGVADSRPPNITNLTLQNNLMNSGNGWMDTSAYATDYAGATQDHNLIVNTSGGSPPAYMSADLIAANDAAVGFVNVTAADAGGDYHGYALAPSSTYKGAASDGTDPGVNFTTLDAALGGSISTTLQGKTTLGGKAAVQ